MNGSLTLSLGRLGGDRHHQLLGVNHCEVVGEQVVFVGGLRVWGNGENNVREIYVKARSLEASAEASSSTQRNRDLRGRGSGRRK